MVDSFTLSVTVSFWFGCWVVVATCLFAWFYVGRVCLGCLHFRGMFDADGWLLWWVGLGCFVPFGLLHLVMLVGQRISCCFCGFVVAEGFGFIGLDCCFWLGVRICDWFGRYFSGHFVGLDFCLTVAGCLW